MKVHVVQEWKRKIESIGIRKKLMKKKTICIYIWWGILIYVVVYKKLGLFSENIPML